MYHSPLAESCRVHRKRGCGASGDREGAGPGLVSGAGPVASPLLLSRERERDHGAEREITAQRGRSRCREGDHGAERDCSKH